ncbi:EamA family transporter, partial [Erwinia amylovora]|nr:EamA family transporter [Erwinia amylovora]
LIRVRFATAAVHLALLSRRVLRGITWPEIKAGTDIGLALGGGYGLQAYGLQSLSGSNSAFSTALSVPLVPRLQWIFLGRMAGLM